MVEMDSAPSKTFRAPKILKFDSYKVDLQNSLQNFLKILSKFPWFWAKKQSSCTNALKKKVISAMKENICAVVICLSLIEGKYLCSSLTRLLFCPENHWNSGKILRKSDKDFCKSKL